jgi:hypothetical protein
MPCILGLRSGSEASSDAARPAFAPLALVLEVERPVESRKARSKTEHDGRRNGTHGALLKPHTVRIFRSR